MAEKQQKPETEPSLPTFPTSPTTPTSPTIPENVKKIRVFSIERVRAKCIITGVSCCPALMCEVSEDGKSRRGYVDPQYALDSDMLNEADRSRVSKLVQATSTNWKNLSNNPYKLYLTPGTSENNELKELMSWEAADAYKFPELSDKMATRWQQEAKSGITQGINSSVSRYMNFYGNSRDQLRILRKLAYGCAFPALSALYIIGRLRAWTSDEKDKVSQILLAIDSVKKAGIYDRLVSICSTSKFRLTSKDKNEDPDILLKVADLIRPWSLVVAEEDTESGVTDYRVISK